MAKSASTNGMPLYNGLAAAVNQYGQIEAMAFTPKIVSKAASYTCLAAESGTVFNTVGATGAVTFTLPAVADGPYQFRFINAVDQNMAVAAPTDTLVTFNDATATSCTFSTAGNKIGAGLLVVCDGAKVYAFPSGANTMTVA